MRRQIGLPAEVLFQRHPRPVADHAIDLTVVEAAFSGRPDTRRLWIEDGKGQPLGRSFRVKLWPTLLFLRDGQEVARVVRPTNPDALATAFDTLFDAASRA